MPRYSEERKEAVLRKMLPPENRPLSELAAVEGISAGTLYHWRRQARANGRLLPDAAAGAAGWSAADKFAAVVESAALNAAQLGEYCRRRGLYPQQIQAWRAACEQANDLEQERARQARGEEASLLVLSKKASGSSLVFTLGVAPGRGSLIEICRWVCSAFR